MKIIWYPAVSLDGYVADARGRSDFVSAEDEREFSKLVNATGAIIVGRRTYDQYHRPQNPFPKARTYVLTQSTDASSDDPAVVYVSGGPLEMMRRLHSDGRTVAVLSGGGTTSGLFAGKGLIDEAWISLYPLILGAGTRVLGEYQGTMRFMFKEGFMLPGGIVHNRYDVA
jgi:dihydrofolate reductase